jgi:hypothetical protein
MSFSTYVLYEHQKRHCLASIYWLNNTNDNVLIRVQSGGEQHTYCLNGGYLQQENHKSVVSFGANLHDDDLWICCTIFMNLFITNYARRKEGVLPVDRIAFGKGRVRNVIGFYVQEAQNVLTYFTTYKRVRNKCFSKEAIYKTTQDKNWQYIAVLLFPDFPHKSSRRHGDCDA